MIIDGHAHACGEYFDYDSIIKVLDENKVDKNVLCPGEVNKDFQKIQEWISIAKRTSEKCMVEKKERIEPG